MKYGMTTTVYDAIAPMVASDTRWSATLTLSDGNNYLVYVDDCEFEKVADRKNAVLILAGDGKLIAEWKDWWYNSLDTDKLPSTDIGGQNAVNLMIVDKVNNVQLFNAGQKRKIYRMGTSEVVSYFAGSGDVHAASCWLANQCAKTSIVSASQKDYFTSSDVKFVEFQSGKSNIAQPHYNYDTIVNALLTRGNIMDLAKSTAANDVGTPLNQHEIFQEVQQQLTTGQAVASAPVPGISDFKWDEEKRKDLIEAIDKVKELENL
jgi:hypothetical protein